MNKKRERAFLIGFKKRKLKIKEYLVCKSFFSRLRGLMFRSSNFKTPLLFVFKKPGRYPIHSFFCRKFGAIWMLNEKIIKMEIVKPWRFSVTPKRKFNKLLEIPQNWCNSVGENKI